MEMSLIITSIIYSFVYMQYCIYASMYKYSKAYKIRQVFLMYFYFYIVRNFLEQCLKNTSFLKDEMFVTSLILFAVSSFSIFSLSR